YGALLISHLTHGLRHGLHIPDAAPRLWHRPDTLISGITRTSDELPPTIRKTGRRLAGTQAGCAAGNAHAKYPLLVWLYRQFGRSSGLQGRSHLLYGWSLHRASQS